MSRYNKEFQKVIDSHLELPNSEGVKFKRIELGETDIDISGKLCKVAVARTESGHIEIVPIDEGIFGEDGWLCDGTCTEGYGDGVNITKFIH